MRRSKPCSTIARDLDQECRALAKLPNDHPRLRPYQAEANAAIERAVSGRKRRMLVAMATGTGKTFTMVNQVYRLMKSGVARRILFHVDRRVLAAQAVQAFASFEPESGFKFNQIYEVYSQRLRREDLDDPTFGPKMLQASYLLDPDPSHAFVYVSTIQRMAINLFGRDAVFELGDEPIDDDADGLPEPEELATDAIAELEGAVEELHAILVLLENGSDVDAAGLVKAVS